MIKIKFFNIILNKQRKLKKKLKFFKSIKVGDIVWAKMPLKNTELQTIEENHRIRPYLIVYKSLFNAYAYQTSSKKSKALNNYEIYGISKFRYKKNKNTWIDLSRVHKIPFTKFKTKFCDLNLMDLKAIEKRLQIQKNRKTKIKYTFGQSIYISEGDVIWQSGKMCYIYASDNLNLYGYRIFKKHQFHKKIKINRKKYHIDINDKIVLKRDSDMKILDIASMEEMNDINNLKKSLKSKKEIKGEKKPTKKYETGTVFQAGKSKIVYLFKNNGRYYGVDALMYQIFPRILEIHNIEEKQIAEIYDVEKYWKIVEFLLLKNINPYNKIQELYEEVKEIKTS